MSTRTRKAAAGIIALMSSAAVAAAVAPGAASATRGHHDGHHHRGATVAARLEPLNNSGVSGRAVVHTHGRALGVRIDASGLAPNLPHAQHIHYGAEARHECPTVADDANGDFRLTTVEGVPAYGPVAVSLTKRGSTSNPADVLAVDRYPTAPGGQVHYTRMTTSTKAVARAIRRGEGVVVIHGVDYNGNGIYDFTSAGASDLDPTLPAEATDPAVCGVLQR